MSIPRSPFLGNGRMQPFVHLVCSGYIWHRSIRAVGHQISLILLMWSWIYSLCSFRYVLFSSFCAILCFWVLVLVRFLLVHRDVVWTLSCFSLTANVFHGILCFALSLVGMHSAAASIWVLTKFSYYSEWGIWEHQQYSTKKWPCVFFSCEFMYAYIYIYIYMCVCVCVFNKPPLHMQNVIQGHFSKRSLRGLNSEFSFF